MSFLDIIIFVFCAIAFVLGYKDGFVRKLIGTLGFFLAVYLGIKFAVPGGTFLNKVMGVEPEFAKVLGGFFIFVLVIFITSLLKRVIHPFDKVNNLINRIVGGFVGSLQILFFLSAAFYFMNIFGSPAKESRDKSMMYGTVASILPAAIEKVTGGAPLIERHIRTPRDSTKVKSK